MKKFIIFLLCVAVIGGGGFFGYSKYMADKQEKIEVDVVPVSLMMQPSEWFEYGMNYMSGQVVASNAQRVYIDTQKLVKEVFVEEGQQVKKGDPILEYDMTVVELELAQKENSVRIIEQDIKMAKKELENIRNYKPAEDAPKPPEPDYHEFPDDFEFPDFSEESSLPDYSSLPDIIEEPELPAEPPRQLTRDVIKPAFTPAEGDGTLEKPFIINCTDGTEVSKEFMIRLFSENKCAEICVYNSDFLYIYKWIIVPDADVSTEEMESWKVSDGITIDEEGQLSIDNISHYGKLSFTPPTTEKSQEDSSSEAEADSSVPAETDPMPEMPEEGNWYDGYEYPDYDPSDYYIDPDGTDYVYSRDAIKKMISDQENVIKELEISLKMANFELETAKKQKKDGKLYAEIDGYVKKIGKASGDEDAEEEQPEEEDYYEEPSADDRAFAVIEGEGGTEVICEITELNLDKAKEGDTINIMSWNTGASGTAEIAYVEEEPRSYSNYSWGENPNNSTYILHAKLISEEDFSIGDWIEVTMNGTVSEETESSGSVYMPIHYIRQEGGDYYIMKADEDGRLKKQYVKAGQIMWGMYIEIKGGLSAKDKICFPYGKDVKEGVKTRETNVVLQPENYYY